VYYRTNLTLRQVAPLFGVSKSAAGRVVDHLAPLLTLAPVTRWHRPDTVLIVDGTPVPAHDRSMAASSKNYRYSANLQVVIDTNTRLTVAVGKPLPGNRNDCRAYAESGVARPCRGAHVIADGGGQGTGVIMPCRRAADGTVLPAWKVAFTTVHKRVGARVEHALAHLTSWNIPRNCRRTRLGVWHAALGVAQMRNLSTTYRSPHPRAALSLHSHTKDHHGTAFSVVGVFTYALDHGVHRRPRTGRSHRDGEVQ
jgi:hypothetical protein